MESHLQVTCKLPHSLNDDADEEPPIIRNRRIARSAAVDDDDGCIDSLFKRLRRGACAAADGLDRLMVAPVSSSSGAMVATRRPITAREGSWSVEAVFIGENTTEHNRLWMRNGIMHGAAQRVSENDSFHPIEWIRSIFANGRAEA